MRRDSQPPSPKRSRKIAFCASRPSPSTGASKSAGEDEQEQRAVVMHGKATELPAGLAVHDVNFLVARPIASDFECGDHVAELFLEAMLRPKGQPADRRMQTVGADQQVEPPVAAALQLDLDAIVTVLQRDDVVAELPSRNRP